MFCSYRDITDRLGTPLWWDEVGVPRYCEFTPDERHARYSGTEVALLEIACQGCGDRFNVAMSWGRFDSLLSTYEVPSLSQQIEDKSIHYGDPPNFGCCLAGPTMNCLDLRVLEFWRRGEKFDFQRVPELEVELPDLVAGADDD